MTVLKVTLAPSVSRCSPAPSRKEPTALHICGVNGSKIGFDYVTETTSTSYYYVYNLQGDVIAIIDSNNTTVVEYTYNEWGKLTATTGTLATTIGLYNGKTLDIGSTIYDDNHGFLSVMMWAFYAYVDPINAGRDVFLEIFE